MARHLDRGRPRAVGDQEVRRILDDRLEGARQLVGGFAKARQREEFLGFLKLARRGYRSHRWGQFSRAYSPDLGSRGGGRVQKKQVDLSGHESTGANSTPVRGVSLPTRPEARSDGRRIDPTTAVT